jgi:hypothetical protein
VAISRSGEYGGRAGLITLLGICRTGGSRKIDVAMAHCVF